MSVLLSSEDGVYEGERYFRNGILKRLWVLDV